MRGRQKGWKVQQWINRLERFGDSGQSVAQFCRAEGVSSPSLYYWKKRLGFSSRGKQASKGIARRASKSKAVFKPVQLLPGMNAQHNTTIRLAEGIEIELGNDLQVVALVVQSVLKEALQNQASSKGDTSC